MKNENRLFFLHKKPFLVSAQGGGEVDTFLGAVETKHGFVHTNHVKPKAHRVQSSNRILAKLPHPATLSLGELFSHFRIK